MGKRGRKRDLDREIRYWELLASGVGTVEACRRVGVTRKTGYRWRSEMGGVIAKKPSAVSGRYLSLFERQRIASWRDRGASVRDIARRIGRSPSTVSRELRRNCRDWDDSYEPVLAHLRAHERAKRPKPGKIASSPWLAKTIQAKLAQHWSPEQIHLHLRAQHGTDPARTVCVESIYQALYRPTEDGLSRSLTRRLRTGRALRRRQRRADRRSPRFGTAMRTIHDRAPEALDRTEPGHWESQCRCQAVIGRVMAGST
jgi:IS30 family transposase